MISPFLRAYTWLMIPRAHVTTDDSHLVIISLCDFPDRKSQMSLVSVECWRPILKFVARWPARKSVVGCSSSQSWSMKRDFLFTRFHRWSLLSAVEYLAITYPDPDGRCFDADWTCRSDPTPSNACSTDRQTEIPTVRGSGARLSPVESRRVKFILWLNVRFWTVRLNCPTWGNNLVGTNDGVPMGRGCGRGTHLSYFVQCYWRRLDVRDTAAERINILISKHVTVLIYAQEAARMPVCPLVDAYVRMVRDQRSRGLMLHGVWGQDPVEDLRFHVYGLALMFSQKRNYI